MAVFKHGHQFFDTSPRERRSVPSPLEPQWAHDWLDPRQTWHYDLQGWVTNRLWQPSCSLGHSPLNMAAPEQADAMLEALKGAFWSALPAGHASAVLARCRAREAEATEMCLLKLQFCRWKELRCPYHTLPEFLTWASHRHARSEGCFPLLSFCVATSVEIDHRSTRQGRRH